MKLERFVDPNFDAQIIPFISIRSHISWLLVGYESYWWTYTDACSGSLYSALLGNTTLLSDNGVQDLPDNLAFLVKW